MARKRDKEKAIKLRLKGASYSEIKSKLNISKSTLSNWLTDYPLSRERIRELRDNNPKRIERFRNTMKKKREAKELIEYKRVSRDIGHLNERDLFISGLVMYWAEGTKTKNCEVAIANTDPAVIRLFIWWLESLGVKRKNLRVRLHLYSDMNEIEEIEYWIKMIKLKKNQFRKTYIKKSRRDEITYTKGRFGHGTCNIMYGNRQLSDYVLMGMKVFSELI